jgi:8-oxo-dGTP diphosphatase
METALRQWRSGENDLHQISYCYRASLIDDTGMPQLTNDEVLDGLKHEWASVEGAIEKMGCQPTSELGRYIKERDLNVVQTYISEM